MCRPGISICVARHNPVLDHGTRHTHTQACVRAHRHSERKEKSKAEHERRRQKALQSTPGLCEVTAAEQRCCSCSCPVPTHRHSHEGSGAHATDLFSLFLPLSPDRHRPDR